MPYVDRFLDFLNPLPNCWMYLMLGLSAFVENVFPPIPGDTITAFGAFLVGTGRLSFFWVYTTTTLGSLAGFMSLYWVGIYLGKSFFLERDYRFFKARDILRAESWFQKYGYLLIVLNRFFPGVRSAIAVAGGISRLKVFSVAVLALMSCSLWNLIWIFLGYSLGANWETVKGKMATILVHYNLAVLILAVGAVGFFLMKRRVLKVKRK